MNIEQITLIRTPQGAPTEDDFLMEAACLPTPTEGQALVQVLALSLDPYLRSAMSGRHLSAAIAPGDVVRGEGLVQVLASQHARMTPGTTWVVACGWRSHALLDATTIAQARPVSRDVQPPTLALGVLGMPGLTAWAGFKKLACANPGDTLVVSAASGPVGATVGQLARLAGCRVIGIAGGADKCRWLTGELGFDAAVDYKNEDVGEALDRLAPDGIDLNFENVGGDIMIAVYNRLKTHGRMAVCGLISAYNATKMPPSPNFSRIITHRLNIQGFLVLDYAHRAREMVTEMGPWLQSGEVKWKVHVDDGLEGALHSLNRLFTGDHDGKLLVRVSEEPAG